jgi:hypothetical protein
MHTRAQTKRALIVAIGKYDFAKTGWRPINVDNDVLLIQEALKRQNFPKENIITLKDGAATRAGIEQAMDELARNAVPGDIIVIHFSSHGQQLEDDGDDEMDRLDEAIVPYGAIYSNNPVDFPKYAPGYIRDDTFGDKITAIRNALGSKGDLLVLLDACHSGTGTRGPGEAVVRGANTPMVSTAFDPNKIKTSDNAGVFKENSKLRLNVDAATYVVFSGAQAQELNWESRDEKGKPVGSLSYAFSKALSTLDGNTSYRTLFAGIENVMREKAPKQKPVMEGDGVDRQLFGGNYVKQKAYFTINEAQSNKDAIDINAGTVSGVTEGSIVSFYPPGTVDPAGKEPLRKGVVTAARNFTSTVKLDKPDNELFKKAPWAFITELSYGGKKIKLKVNSAIQGAAAKAQTAFRTFPLVQLDNNGDLYLDTCGSVDKWIFKYSISGETFGDRKDSTFSISDTARMRETLRRFDRYQYLQNLKFTEDGLAARVELVFLKPDRTIDSVKMAARTNMTGLELQAGDEVYLKIVNTGEKNFFINIVDIQPDGRINPLLPNKNLRDRNNRLAPIKAENCKVNKGDSVLYKDLTITIGPPYGDETLKVFLSGETLDLEDILTDDVNDSQSRGPGGVLNNMAKIFKSSKVSGNKTRGTNPTVNTAQNGTIFSVPFRIVPKGK